MKRLLLGALLALPLVAPGGDGAPPPPDYSGGVDYGTPPNTADLAIIKVGIGLWKRADGKFDVTAVVTAKGAPNAVYWVTAAILSDSAGGWVESYPQTGAVRLNTNGGAAGLNYGVGVATVTWGPVADATVLWDWDVLLVEAGHDDESEASGAVYK